jgi:hypothetical protein
MRMLHAAYAYADVCVCYMQRGQYQARPPAEVAEGLARAEERAAVLRQVAGSIRIRQHTYTLHEAYAYVSMRLSCARRGACGCLASSCR